ncbi:MAG: arsenic efflux protein [Bacteroidales bacterium]|nr:arsenic efflux protein [Bacteroidales bacterium]
MITSFVLAMMLLIEYFTVRTKSKILTLIGKNPWTQIIIAAFLGIIPGCLGTFVAVSLYSHRVLAFPALVTVMIASSGDEAFVMFGEIPHEALMITIILFIVAILTGFILNIFMKNKNFMKLKNNMLHEHKQPECVAFDRKKLIEDYKNISFQRALLIFGTFIALIFIIIGEIGPKEWSEEKISLIIISSIVLFIVSTVPEHFLVEHLWKHTIKRHILKIFLWTFGALLAIELLMPLLNISQETFVPIAQKYYFLILLFAVLVGFIPESGPNMVFIFLFASGYIPLSILIANSIVQDGHGGLPLLAESRKSFIYSKLINMIVGVLFGVVGYLFSF